MTQQTPKQKILAIGAHAADMELTAGMTMAKYIRAGGAGTFLHLTAGERGHPTKSGDEYAAQKREEAVRAAAALGAHMQLFEYHDGELPYNDEVAFRVADVIRAEKPDIVITHWKNSMHKDHARTYQIVQDAVFYAALRTIERPLPRHAVRGLYFSDNWEDQEGYVPDVYVSIEDADFDAWRQCCSAYQLFRGGVSSFRYRDYYEALATTRGCVAFTTRANAFKLWPEQAVRGGAWLPLPRP